MKTASVALTAHITGGQMTLAYIWKIKRADGALLGFTNHDQDITYDAGDGDGSVTYYARTGFSSSANSGKSDLSVDNLEAVGFLDSAQITENDLRANLYDDADIKVLIVNWNDLTMGHIVMRRGTLGVVKLENGKFTAELRGLTYRLASIIGDSYGPLCRAEFGSGLNGIDLNSRYLCMIDVTLWRQAGTVGSGSTPTVLATVGGLSMTGSATPLDAAPDGWFDDGFLTFTSGVLNGLSFEIKHWQTAFPGGLGLFLPMPFAPSPGDTFEIEPGCDKTVGTCFAKFNNIVNFRGEPFIPGMDKYLDVPGAGGGIG